MRQYFRCSKLCLPSPKWSGGLVGPHVGICSRSLSEFENTANFQPALIEIEDALVPGFFVEQHTNDRCTVFVPSVPTPMAGAIYIIATSPSRVHRLNLPVIKVMQCISKCGSGSDALVAADYRRSDRAAEAQSRNPSNAAADPVDRESDRQWRLLL
jgi:hypothetical protein